MKDIEKREKGKYKKTFKKIIDSKEYTITEEYTIGRDFEIIGYSREFNPAITYPFNW